MSEMELPPSVRYVSDVSVPSAETSDIQFVLRSRYVSDVSVSIVETSLM